jgi:hypothetical protein
MSIIILWSRILGSFVFSTAPFAGIMLFMSQQAIFVVIEAAMFSAYPFVARRKMFDAC